MEEGDRIGVKETPLPPEAECGKTSGLVAKAEGDGFEPSNIFRCCRFSRPMQSAALPPLQIDQALPGPFGKHTPNLNDSNLVRKRTGQGEGLIQTLL